MLFKTLVLAATAVGPTLALATFNLTRSCNTPEMEGAQLQSFKAVAEEAANMQRPESNMKVAAIDSAQVNVYVHVVAAGRTFDEGWVSVSQFLPIPTLFTPSQET